MPDPCKDKYDDYSDAWDDYSAKHTAATKGLKNAGVFTAGAAAVCVGTWWTGVGLLACAVGGAYALNSDFDSIWASLELDEAIDKRDDAWAAYKKCVEQHKQYYKQ
jgi:hypothetical protein